MNALEVALEIVTDIKAADRQIEAAKVGEEVEIDIPDLDVPLRLRGNKHVRIAAVTVVRTQ